MHLIYDIHCLLCNYLHMHFDTAGLPTFKYLVSMKSTCSFMKSVCHSSNNDATLKEITSIIPFFIFLITGRSYLYISTSNKNPGPLDQTGTIKNTGIVSPRASSVDLSSLSNKV